MRLSMLRNFVTLTVSLIPLIAMIGTCAATM
ncbi:hypothetical protein BH09PSE4_BH09PSE4_09860 [soil metagenome]